MDRGAVLDALARVTANWSPGPGTDAGELDAARGALAGLFAAETHPEDVRAALASRAEAAPLEEAIHARLDPLVDAATAAPPDQRVIIRRGRNPLILVNQLRVTGSARSCGAAGDMADY